MIWLDRACCLIWVVLAVTATLAGRWSEARECLMLSILLRIVVMLDDTEGEP